jgi:hypothetical protein
MRMYRVTIVMPDGSRGEHRGRYPCAARAVLAALEIFPEAHRVSATLELQ